MKANLIVGDSLEKLKDLTTQEDQLIVKDHE